MSKRDKFVVITTINEPTDAVRRFRDWSGYELVVVGDRKTSPGWECEGVTYLGMDDQHEQFGELAQLLPENTYTRKVIGYAYAIRHGAKAIFESDDDNLPYDGAEEILDACLASPHRQEGRRLKSSSGWVNIYNRFGAPDCWPRGFPLEMLHHPEVAGVPGQDTKPWGVMQFLADRDPDVDAVYRMVSGKPVNFMRGERFLLDEATYCPMNSQATLWLPETFPLMFLPLGVTDRVTDILRGYVALACLWKTGMSLGYASPVVYQDRNAHNLLRDFQQEVDLYCKADAWSRLLLQIEGTDPITCFRSAISLMSGRIAGFERNHEAYGAFLHCAGLAGSQSHDRVLVAA